MEPYYSRNGITIYHGDNREVLPHLTATSIVCDPPYHLTNRVPDVLKCAACGRVCGGRDGEPDACPRCGAELARQRSQLKGFMGREWDGTGVSYLPDTWRTIRDALTPGGYLLAFGGSRTFHRIGVAIEDGGFELRDTLMWLYGTGFPKSHALLKPAFEPVIMARRPGPLAMLNVDACRIGYQSEADMNQARVPQPVFNSQTGNVYGFQTGTGRNGETFDPSNGRWPANVLLGCCGEEPHAAGCAVGELDRQSGVSRSVRSANRNGRDDGQVFAMKRKTDIPRGHNDTGTASRFFYVAKASRAERGEGNDWPTVKPLTLMRYLVRLVAPTVGIVLDPFMGSGTTLLAAAMEGRPAVGIDADEHACEIAARRAEALEAQLPLAVNT